MPPAARAIRRSTAASTLLLIQRKATWVRAAVVRVDLAGLRQAGYDVPDVTQVPRKFNMPGGGIDVVHIPPE